MSMRSAGAATVATMDNAHSVRRSAMLWLLLADEVLLFVGVWLYPSVLGEGGLLGIGAATAILLIYGFLALYSPASYSKADPSAVRSGVILGLLGGIVLSVD